MPELPEVEVVCRGLAPHLPGRRVEDWRHSGACLRLPVPAADLDRWVAGAGVAEVFRRAKYVVLAMTNGAWLAFHLGMTGRLGLFAAPDALARHDHLCLGLDNGMELRFNDSRRFGSARVLPPGAGEPFFAAMGLEPFGSAFTAAALGRLAAGRTRPVKNFLMDGRLVAGIGNIYANEILHAAGISPFRPVCELLPPEWDRIVARSRGVLRQAIAAGGSTIADFIGAGGEQGYFQLRLRVYGRAGRPCPCGGVVQKTRQAGRATYFCAQCQK